MTVRTPALLVRPERAEDHSAVFEVNRRAFGGDLEARLVDGLRREAGPLISLVAQLEEHLVGHILFSPVAVEEGPRAGEMMALGPMAVLPEHQRRGAGSRLVEAGLDACRELDAGAVFVLGHPEYYPRFGFQPATQRGLYYKSAAFDPFFMVLELQPGVLVGGPTGEVRYHPLFDEV